MLLSRCNRQIIHALLTRPPLSYTCYRSEDFQQRITPLDLHVLGTPPAFTLSQDQTLRFIVLFFRSSLLRICISALASPLRTEVPLLSLTCFSYSPVSSVLPLLPFIPLLSHLYKLLSTALSSHTGFSTLIEFWVCVSFVIIQFSRCRWYVIIDMRIY